MTLIIDFETLANNYPSPETLSHDDLFNSLGWEDIKSNPAYANTCAIRMSLCLIRSGISLPGRLKIHKGTYKNQLIEPGQLKLSNILSRPNFFGQPDKLMLKDREKHLMDKKGIISFMKIPGYYNDGLLSGHIDLVRHGKFFYFFDVYTCLGHCSWDSTEFWFWPL